MWPTERGGLKGGQSFEDEGHIIRPRVDNACWALLPRKEIVMLERYFVRPETVDRIRASWIGPAIERYVARLTEQGYAARSVLHRVPILMRFAEFARERGATACEDLPSHVTAFVERWVQDRGPTPLTEKRRDGIIKEVRNPIEQVLRFEVPGFIGSKRRPAAKPLRDVAPTFFQYLSEERGLQKARGRM